MTFRTVVQDGLIVVNTHGSVPDGTPVRVSVAKRTKQIARTSKKTTSVRKQSKRQGRTPGFGMWADWDELGVSGDAVADLRSLTRRRRVA